MKTKLIALLLALAMVFSLTACGTSGNNAENTAPAQSSAPVQNTDAQKQDDPIQEQPAVRVFTDDAGREVEVPLEISRIVPSGALAQIVLLAIAPDMFVGLGSKFYDEAKGIVPDYLFDLPYFGSLYAGADLNVEELALTEPDIIIDIGDSMSTAEEDLNALQDQTQIPSVFVYSDLKNMPETYRKLGELLGRAERGEELAQFCERVYNRTLSIMEQVGDNKVNCLYVLGEEGLNVIASGSYHAELLDLLTNNLAVVDNPLSKGTGNEVSMEQIAIWNPDFIVFGPNSIYATVKDNETWGQISAIANDNYVEVPSTPHNWMSMPPSVQRYLGLIWLTAELYPDYCDYDVKAEITEYFKLFYGCDLTDEQYDAITANAFLK